MKIPYAYKFGKAFVPKGIRPNLKKYLFKANIFQEPYTFFGIMFYIGSIISLFIYLLFIYPYFIGLKETISSLQFLFIIGFGTFVSITTMLFLISGFIIIVIYFFLDLKIFNRTRKLEEILPDFFDVVTSNLKGGLSFEKSLWMAIKPRFGILANEIAIAAKKVMTGHDIDTALKEFSTKYNSPMLKRSIDLIISELHEGGKISNIMERIVVDLKKSKILKEEMSASVLAYIIFISIIVTVISPILFSLALNLLQVIQNIMGLVSNSLGDSNAIGITISTVALDPNQFITFSHVALAIIAIGASMIVAIIEKGAIRSGIKYIPIYLTASQLIYIVSIKIMEVVFGNMMSF